MPEYTKSVLTLTASQRLELMLKPLKNPWSSRRSGGSWYWSDRSQRGQQTNNAKPTLLARAAAVELDSGEPPHHRLDRLGFEWLGRWLAKLGATLGQFRMPAAVS